MRNRFIVLALACVAASTAFTPAVVAAAPAAKPVTHTVTIEGTQFAPASLTVNRGDTVVWVNKDPFPHTATAKGVFDSKIIAAGKSWRYKATRAGEFQYVCTLHPTMKGTLAVH